VIKKFINDLRNKKNHSPGFVGLKNNLICLLITPFTSAPLIDMIVEKGFDVFSEERSPGYVHTYIKKQNPS